MAKSKRQKIVSLTKTSKKGKLLKENLLNLIKESCDKFSTIFIFTVENMRNIHFKKIRQIEDTKFFFGRNNIMAKALGTSVEEEYKINLRLISEVF